eukprot:TRINITY_DN3485_c0_g1_i1.p1 TRINITY_DN3485_c0_g1~~TRINITY_DN3485_c0_g1_i1.p1  ORF type:complete len:916 (-),score=185.26 TRINITY_DN3485_c0_g1_i1:40-2787(-)
MKFLPWAALLALLVANGAFSVKFANINNAERRRSFEDEHTKLRSSRPPGAPIEFDCAARELAYEYAVLLQGWRGNLQSVFDALELSTLCNKTNPEPREKIPLKFPRSTSNANSTFFVSVSGSDSNSGGIDDPFQTIQRAVDQCRLNEFGSPCTIYLRQGTFYLQKTIYLGPEVSGMTISSYNNEEVFISGGIPINTQWKPYQVQSEPNTDVWMNMDNAWGRAAYKADTQNLKYLGIYADWQGCEAACVKFNKGGQLCRSFSWNGNDSSVWAGQCYGGTDDVWGPVPQNLTVSGRIVQLNVWVASLEGQNIQQIPGMQTPQGTSRVFRARYPNANTEINIFPDGWMLVTQNWTAPKNYPAAKTILITEPQRNDAVEFQQYSIGVGGPCSIFTPPESYWCSAYNSGGGASVFETPQGLTFFEDSLPNVSNWTDVEDAIIHVWHPAHWAMWMYEVDSVNKDNNTILWNFGGFQGARGGGCCGGTGGEWYLDNVFSELDSPNEYFYDADNELLYFFYNGTTAPPENFTLEVSNLKVLFDVTGTQQDPVQDLTIQGLNFVNTAYTYMDPHGVPSGGDWAMQRTAALQFEGTENLNIFGNLFLRLDGNALLLSGYHRGATITNNEFNWIGDSAMVAWGYTDLMDGTSGEQPRGTIVNGNLVHELGHFEKQASPWFQAKACQTLLSGNIFFNGPRALINFNDGFGGANEIVANLLFNPNRETSDQGPFNSWDRMPFLTEVRNGTPSLMPAYNNIHNNFMLCNFGSNMCIDNDDGSAYYRNHHNFEVYGGHKSDFGGHNKFTFDTVIAYAQDYAQGLCGDFWDAVPGYVDGFYNNICIQGSSPEPYLTISSCNATHMPVGTMPVLGNNTIYNAYGNLSVQCGNGMITEEELQSLGYDLGTIVKSPLPSTEEILAWGKQLLGMA